MADPFEPLLEEAVDPDPLAQFGQWFDDAATVVANPEAMAVATADPDGRPSVRMVLLKSWGVDGFVFHTNYDSRKGRELAVNPRTALLFYWEPKGRQVRIEGTAERTEDLESDAYFATRPLGGQIGAHASHQSQPIADRWLLDRQVEEVSARYAGSPVPRPAWWGGLRVRPQAYEFWQNREDRLHDRLRYTPDAGGWRITRLQP
jgi:pyridoxamine 5'-phosphate oxidase